jgi:cytochrome c oxidase cbb3-type subunit III
MNRSVAEVALARVVVVVLVLVLVLLSGASSVRAGQEEADRGRKLFESHCTRCHGIGGTGGEGPSLARPRLRHASDDEALLKVIRNGIDGTDMPDAWQLSDKEVRDVVVYVRFLSRVEPSPVAGDRSRGRELFSGKGACTSCHIVGGEGGILGPDLSEVGLLRGASYLRESLVSPEATVPEGYLLVRAVTSSGEVVEGVRVNEDSFSIQVRDGRGRFHSLRKLELKELHKRFGESPMPSYRAELTDEELDDLVAYLVSLRGDP